jgi:H+/Cl- antiporter ClcA
MSTTPESPPPSPRSGCLTGLMILVGIVLLLPGLCALLFGGMALSERHFESDLVPFIVFGLLAGAVGIVLIRAAFRSR